MLILLEPTGTPRRYRPAIWARLLLLLFINLTAFCPLHSHGDTTDYRIPAGPLGKVLTQFGADSGLLFTFDPAITRQKTSSGLNGRFSPEQGLQELLKGQQFHYKFVDATTVTIEKNPHEAPLLLAPIQVKGELQERTLQETQTSVAVVTGAQLERRSEPDLFSLIERIPGVTKFNDGEFAIRGIRQRGPSASRGNSRLVQVSVDGATISNFEILTWRGPYSMWDLDQVEVLRGPQSTQSGRNALAGAINLRSKDPGYDPEFKARGEFGTDSTWGSSFAYNQPIVEGTLALRAAADLRKSAGFVTNSTLDDEAGETDSRTYRLGLAWDPTEVLSAVLKYSRHDDRAGQPLVADGTYEATNDYPKFVDTESDILNLRLDYEFSPNLSLESETAYLTADIFQTDDGDRSASPGSEFIRDRNADNLEQQLKLLHKGDGVNGVFGLYYLNYQEDSITAGSFGSMTLDLSSDSEIINKAVFAELESRFFNNWRLIAGIRYDDETFEEDSLSIFNNAGVPELIEGSYNAFLPKLGIVYDFTDDISLGLTYQEAYRAGGAVNSPNFGVVPFDPEFTNNYELALRSQFYDQRLTFNANIFLINWSDQQVGQGQTFEEFRIVNAGESEQHGAEFDLQWQPTSQWDLFASAAFVKTEFTNFVDGTNDLSGNEFPAAPTWTAALGATYFFANRWRAALDGSYTDKSFVEASNDLEHDSRFLVNANLGYETEHWDLLIYARNLFDKYYLTDRFATAGPALGRAGEPLTAGVIISYQY